MMKYLFMLLLILPLEGLAQDIEVQALFAGAAVLVIDGRRELLRQGEAKSGVTLLSADTEKAVIETAGRQQTVKLSDRITSNFSAPERATVMIAMNENRQYFTQGVVNGRSVRFLVDTGANVVSLDSATAADLGISVAGAPRTWAQTAGGRTAVTVVSLDDVQIGGIRQRGVRAVVSHAAHPPYLLLGMSFLQHVDISENSGLMVLTSKL